MMMIPFSTVIRPHNHIMIFIAIVAVIVIQMMSMISKGRSIQLRSRVAPSILKARIVTLTSHDTICSFRSFKTNIYTFISD